jgi:hypothetical protein
MSETSQLWAQHLSEGIAPIFKLESLAFFGWHLRPSDKKLMGVYRDAVFGHGGCLSLEDFEKRKQGLGPTGTHSEAAIVFAKRAIDLYPKSIAMNPA